MPKLTIELERCALNKDGTRCPYCTGKLTKGYGYAMDYMCAKMNNRITSGYVEWDRDMNPVPTWCPIRIDKAEIDKRAQEKIMGEGI